ncbi:16132_t:CDS:2 [Racocetra persica]|uniref:16132_t:CDS:1 n=1 Tax=Racocetra persica TaxID=160502 RepID=A0ACA9M044_9GLOM|nr:16132_t:CDS:2 [Racocetra persica]
MPRKGLSAKTKETIQKKSAIQDEFQTVDTRRRSKRLCKSQNIAVTISQEKSKTTPISIDSHNSEVDSVQSEVNSVQTEVNSTSILPNQYNTQAVNLELNNNVLNNNVLDKPQPQDTTDPISSLTHSHEEQSPSWMNTFLDDDENNYATKQLLLQFPILAFSSYNLFYQDATVFEIATFIADHPNILSMANMIYRSKQTKWNQSSTSKELLLGELSTLSDQSIKESTLEARLRIWLEELKCLFLRNRNLSQTTFDHLVAMVLPSSKLADDDFQQLLEKSKSLFSEFHYTLNKDLKNLANEYTKNTSNYDTNVLDENGLNRYIDYDVTKKVLQKYLTSTRESEFIEITRDTLKRFIQAAFKLHVIHIHKESQREYSSYKRVLEDIKNLNSITLSLDIPTRGKSDILRSCSV